jgi:hypothetical protein
MSSKKTHSHLHHSAHRGRRSHHFPLKSPRAPNALDDSLAIHHHAARQVADEYHALSVKIDRESESGFSRADQEYDLSTMNKIGQELAYLPAGERNVALNLIHKEQDEKIKAIKDRYGAGGQVRMPLKPNTP